MAEVAHGTFAARTSTGDQTISGLAFAPQAVIFYCALRTTTGVGVTTSTVETMIGWDCHGSGAPQPCCASNWAKDNVAAAVASGSSTSNFAIQLNGTGAAAVPESQAEVTAWNSDGFTLTYTTAATQAWLINYIAIGGADITDAHSGVFLLTTAAGNQSTSVPGFTPSLLLMAHGADNWGLGFASGSGSTDQATVYGINAPSENPTQTGRSFTVGSVQGGWRAFGAAPPRTLEVDYLVSLNSFDASGFTLAKSNTPAANRGILYLVLKGGTHDVGATAAPAATGVQQVSTDVNPAGVLMFSPMEPSGSSVADLLFSIGGFVSGSSGTVAYGAEDNVTPTVVEQYSGAEALAADLDMSAPSVPSLASGQALAIGSFSLDWTAVSGDAEQFAYWAIGGPLVAPPAQVIRYNRRPRS